MIRLVFVLGGILGFFSSCGTRRGHDKKMQEIPLSVVIGEPMDIDEMEDNLEVSIPVPKEPSLNSKPLKPVLVIFKIEPAEMAQHVPVRTTMKSIGVGNDFASVQYDAYPAPSDISIDKTPITLKNGYFLDRSGFVNASTRFLDMHFDAYKKIPQDTITREWLQLHTIPKDAMYFEWMVCNCNTEDETQNVNLLNSMIEKGIEQFKHPEISTEIHPRYGSSLPKN